MMDLREITPFYTQAPQRPLLAASNANALNLPIPLTVSYGGTGIPSGTTGGVPYFSNSTTIASSGTLAVSQLVIGGGPGQAPTSLTAGPAGQPLVMAGATPGFGPLNLAGTNTVSGVLPLAHGGTNSSAFSDSGVVFCNTNHTSFQTDTVNFFTYTSVSGGNDLSVGANNTSGVATIGITGGPSGGTAELEIGRTDTSGAAQIIFQSSESSGVSHFWQMGVFTGPSENFIIYDVTGSPSPNYVIAMTILSNATGDTAAGDVQVNAGNLQVVSKTKTLAVGSASGASGTANALFVTGITLAAGVATISDSSVTAAHIGFVTRTSDGVSPGSYAVTISGGSFTVTSSSNADTSVVAVLFILPL